MKTAILALLLASCSTPDLIGQQCFMQAVGKTESGLTVVNMACRRLEEK